MKALLALSFLSSLIIPQELDSAANAEVRLVVWHAEDALRAARVRVADGTVLETQPIAIAAGARPAAVDVASDGADFVVVWSEPGLGDSARVLFARVRGSDGAVLDPGGMPVTRATAGVVGPTVVHDGSSYIAWWGERCRVDSEGIVYDCTSKDGLVTRRVPGDLRDVGDEPEPATVSAVVGSLASSGTTWTAALGGLLAGLLLLRMPRFLRRG